MNHDLRHLLLKIVFMNSGATTFEIAKMARITLMQAAAYLRHLAKEQRIRREPPIHGHCRWFFLRFDFAAGYRDRQESAEQQRQIDALLAHKRQIHLMRGRV